MLPNLILFVKSHIPGYTKKDGTVVRDHEDKRQKKAKAKVDPRHKDQPNDPPGYAKRVAEYEDEGMTTSDAQSCADVDFRSTPPAPKQAGEKPKAPTGGGHAGDGDDLFDRDDDDRGFSALKKFGSDKMAKAFFRKAMPKGPVDTGAVYTLSAAQTDRYDQNPSVLAALLKEMKERKTGDMEGNVEIRHAKGYVIGRWQGALSMMDPSFSMPDIAGKG